MRLDFHHLSLSGDGLLGGHFNWTDKAYSVPMAQYEKFIATHACLLVLFICSFVFPVRAGASSGSSSPSELEASDGPGEDELLPLCSSASCLSNVRFALTSTLKGTDARSSGAKSQSLSNGDLKSGHLLLLVSAWMLNTRSYYDGRKGVLAHH